MIFSCTHEQIFFFLADEGFCDLRLRISRRVRLRVSLRVRLRSRRLAPERAFTHCAFSHMRTRT